MDIETMRNTLYHKESGYVTIYDLLETAMNEATYYGKNDNLKQCERLFDEMIKLGKKNKQYTDEFAEKMVKAANILGKTFGFESLTINSCIIQIHPIFMFVFCSPGGCTLTNSIYVKYGKLATPGGMLETVDFDKNHKGIAFKPGAKYKMTMFLGPDLFQDNGENTLTGAEIMAVVLHEIGHNFYYGPVKEFGTEMLTLMDITSVRKLIEMMIINPILWQALPREIDSRLGFNEKKMLTKLNSMTGMIAAPAWAGYHLYMTVMNIWVITELALGTMFLIPEKIIMDMVKGVLKYDAEKYSDAFASSYGYGSELSTALIKIGKIKLPFISKKSSGQLLMDILQGLATIPLQFVDVFCDVHPNNMQRMKNQIKYLEEAANHCENPQLRKELQSQLRELYSTRDRVKKYTGLNLMKMNDALIASIQDCLKIEDPREFISEFKGEKKYMNLDYIMGQHNR